MAGDDALQVSDVDASGCLRCRVEVEVGLVAERSLVRLRVVFRRLRGNAEIIPNGEFSGFVSHHSDQ